jgi:O-antigen biosynthesis protein
MRPGIGHKMRTSERESSRWRRVEIGASQRLPSEHADQIGTSQKEVKESEAQVSALERTISAVNVATSQRVTALLRLTSTSARWLSRTARWILGPVSQASAVHLGKVLLRLLPYYHRYLPESWRIFVFACLPSRLKRQIARVRSNAIMGYQDWILQNDKLDDGDRSLIRTHLASFRSRPKFSILMPIYNAPAQYLREAIDSVLDQLYQQWELCIVDDASTSAEIRKILREYSKIDHRISVRYRDINGGISACTNTALEMATGEWIVLMDHDDMLAEHALYLVAEVISRNPNLAIIYSDEDYIDEKGRRNSPYFKPDWDYDLFLGQNLINHLSVYRTVLTRQVGGFRRGFEGSQDWDLSLRVLEASSNYRVHHIPFVLYHWRQTSQTFSNASIARAIDAARRAVSDHLARTSQAAEVIPVGRSSHLRIKRILPTPLPLVSVIVPTKDRRDLTQKCIDGLVNRTNYKPLEIIIVDNGSSEPGAIDFLSDLRTRPAFVVIEDTSSFNFSRLVNRGVAASCGEICVLLNNDIDVINTDWLDELVSHALRPDVGAVGAKLYYSDDTLQHGGVILGIGGVAGHQHRYAGRGSYGYFNRLKLTHGLSCVTAACLATRRAVYDAVGGFDEKHLAIAYNDVDFCIRVREAGFKIIWTPHAELYHYESASRGYETTPGKISRFAAEKKHMRDQWGEVLDSDPFYNPNLSLNSESNEFAARSRVRKPWRAYASSANGTASSRAF